MPSFDWMKEDRFREEIKEQVIISAANSVMEKYQEAVVERLIDFLIAKREERIMKESLKASYQQNKGQGSPIRRLLSSKKDFS